ncbi:MAG: hypothetical protein F4X65_06065 [Chloroflexi bacterium]|nr:hypothetical protein [Chloroflexota bacterium]
MDYADLLRTATFLANYVDPTDLDGRPSEANLRRSVSTAYYAAFHALSQSCADTLVGPYSEDSNEEYWVAAYRTLEHRQVKNKLNNGERMTRFSDQVRDFAKRLGDLQDSRHRADYDPEAVLEQDDVLQLLINTQAAIEGFNAVPERERRFLAVYLIATLR